VTINGRSANIAGPNGYLQTWNAGDGNLGHTEFDAFARNVNADGNSDFVSFAFPSLALPTSLASSFSSVTGHSGSDGKLGFNSNSVYASGGGYVPQVHAFLAASTVDVVDISAVPIPAVGTGLPGLLLAGGGLLAWWRRRMWI